ncbi:MAG TPA: fibronectin type III domain-containing protein, partial [Candidatus Saccharimonadales bacterium]|nr:fibronectin type III domain-containing protein [Candidatus Saccharimonadales bacterium]
MIRFARIKRKAGAASLAFVFAFVSVVTPLTGLTQRAAAVAEPAPVNLRALVGGNSIGLVWNPAPGSTPTQYKVYRNGVLRATVNPVTDNFSGTTQRYIDTGVVGGTQYTYQIAAMNASFEESQWSSWAQVTQPTNPAPVPTITLDPSIPASLLPLMNNGKALLQAWYPKIHTKLGSVAGVPTSFTLDTDPSPAIVAQTLGTTITVGETFATNNASNAALINNMFIHEATHVIQQYSGLQWAVEGIADYASRYIYGTDTALAINTSTTSWM